MSMSGLVLTQPPCPAGECKLCDGLSDFMRNHDRFIEEYGDIGHAEYFHLVAVCTYANRQARNPPYRLFPFLKIEGPRKITVVAKKQFPSGVPRGVSGILIRLNLEFGPVRRPKMVLYRHGMTVGELMTEARVNRERQAVYIYPQLLPNASLEAGSLTCYQLYPDQRLSDVNVPADAIFEVTPCVHILAAIMVARHVGFKGKHDDLNPLLKEMSDWDGRQAFRWDFQLTDLCVEDVSRRLSPSTRAMWDSHQTLFYEVLMLLRDYIQQVNRPIDIIGEFIAFHGILRTYELATEDCVIMQDKGRDRSVRHESRESVMLAPRAPTVFGPDGKPTLLYKENDGDRFTPVSSSTKLPPPSIDPPAKMNVWSRLGGGSGALDTVSNPTPLGLSRFPPDVLDLVNILEMSDGGFGMIMMGLAHRFGGGSSDLQIYRMQYRAQMHTSLFAIQDPDALPRTYAMLSSRRLAQVTQVHFIVEDSLVAQACWAKLMTNGYDRLVEELIETPTGEISATMSQYVKSGVMNMCIDFLETFGIRTDVTGEQRGILYTLWDRTGGSKALIGNMYNLMLWAGNPAKNKKILESSLVGGSMQVVLGGYKGLLEGPMREMYLGMAAVCGPMGYLLVPTTCYDEAMVVSLMLVKLLARYRSQTGSIPSRKGHPCGREEPLTRIVPWASVHALLGGSEDALRATICGAHFLGICTAADGSDTNTRTDKMVRFYVSLLLWVELGCYVVFDPDMERLQEIANQIAKSSEYERNPSIRAEILKAKLEREEERKRKLEEVEREGKRAKAERESSTWGKSPAVKSESGGVDGRVSRSLPDVKSESSLNVIMPQVREKTPNRTSESVEKGSKQTREDEEAKTDDKGRRVITRWGTPDDGKREETSGRGRSVSPRRRVEKEERKESEKTKCEKKEKQERKETKDKPTHSRSSVYSPSSKDKKDMRRERDRDRRSRSRERSRKDNEGKKREKEQGREKEDERRSSRRETISKSDRKSDRQESVPKKTGGESDRKEVKPEVGRKEDSKPAPPKANEIQPQEEKPMQGLDQVCRCVYCKSTVEISKAESMCRGVDFAHLKFGAAPRRWARIVRQLA